MKKYLFKYKSMKTWKINKLYDIFYYKKIRTSLIYNLIFKHFRFIFFWLCIFGVLSFLLWMKLGYGIIMFIPIITIFFIIILPVYKLLKEKDKTNLLFYLPFFYYFISLTIWLSIWYFYGFINSFDKNYFEYFMSRFLDFQDKYLFTFIFVIYWWILWSALSNNNNTKDWENAYLYKTLILWVLILIFVILFSTYIKLLIPKDLYNCYHDGFNKISDIWKETTKCLKTKNK